MIMHGLFKAAVVLLIAPTNAFSPPSNFITSRSISARRIVNSNNKVISATRQYHESKSSLMMSSEAATAEDPLFEPLGVGLKRDISKRLPFYKSDIIEGIHPQCLAAILFLFFACLAPAVGFGSLFATATGGAIGTIEMVSSTAACGFIYAIFSSQPLTIIGSTGPVLAFVATLATLAKRMNLPFLPLYSWTGLWTSALLLISSLTSGSNMVKYLTRFTDEIFSVLISFIFVLEASANISSSFTSPESTFTKALLSVMCASTTYGIAVVLRKVRASAYFTKGLRKNIANFAPTVGVVAGCLVARWARLTQGMEAAALPILSIPSTFATTSGRPWLVPMMELPVWARWGAFLPALMAYVLLFLDQNITVRVVNNPQYKMKKGRREGNMIDGMHLDLFVISILTALQSIVGLPWLVAATVRSISHVRALSKLDEDGKIKGSREQRITGIGIHALIGCCVLFDKPRAILTQVPKVVLMGLFMFLGTSALPGNEMWERLKGLFKERSDKKLSKFTDIPNSVRNLFTLIQLACLAAMFWVKESPIGVLFPVIIAMLAPVRFGLEKFGIIEKKYMDILDADE